MLLSVFYSRIFLSFHLFDSLQISSWLSCVYCLVVFAFNTFFLHCHYFFIFPFFLLSSPPPLSPRRLFFPSTFHHIFHWLVYVAQKSTNKHPNERLCDVGSKKKNGNWLTKTGAQLRSNGIKSNNDKRKSGMKWF